MDQELMETSSEYSHKEFKECEEIIRKGLNSFVDVGKALLKIKNEKLYRENYESFSEYCRARWNLGASRVYQLINASHVVENLVSQHNDPNESETSENVETATEYIPQIESQVRPLTHLSAEQQMEAWRMAVERAETDYPTGKEVTFAVEELYPDSRKKKTPSTESEENQSDVTKGLVTEEVIRAVFQCSECEHQVTISARDIRLTLYCQIHEQELALHGVLNKEANL